MDNVTDRPDVETYDVAALERREHRPFTKARTKIFPKRVHGGFRHLKWWIMCVTLGVYYFTPWLRWDRGTDLPNQAVLIDFPGQRFYFFFIEIWPQELFFITGLLVMAGVGLFLTTSIAGRAWCGYSCPQTVWTDLFIAVERFIEGDRNARIRLDKAPNSASKLAKRTAKYVTWLVIAMCTGGAWIFYFADAPTLAGELVDFSAPMAAYITIAVLTATTFVLGGLAREQVCTYMCPWPRIMGAMMDEDSLVVTYHAPRGEPRGFAKSEAQAASVGDCVDCNACVAACPMGIDIRNGQQLECITCALCIDACNEVMDKLTRPRGLIGYASVAGEAKHQPLAESLKRVVRPRTLTYFAIWSAVGLVMLYALFTRPILDINVLHDRNPLFVALSDGSVRNGYTFKILNKSHDQQTFRLSLSGLAGATVAVVGRDNTRAMPEFTVKPDRVQSLRLFVTVPRAALKSADNDIRFVLTNVGGGEPATYDSLFRGPKQ